MSLTRVLTLAALASLSTACRSAGHLPVARELGVVVDVLGDEAPLLTHLEGVGEPPWTLLVATADEVDDLLAARGAEPEAASLVDASGLDALALEPLTTRLVEAALEDGGPILVDESGDSARVLTTGEPGVTRVVLRGDRTVESMGPVSAAEDAR